MVVLFVVGCSGASGDWEKTRAAYCESLDTLEAEVGQELRLEVNLRDGERSFHVDFVRCERMKLQLEAVAQKLAGFRVMGDSVAAGADDPDTAGIRRFGLDQRLLAAARRNCARRDHDATNGALRGLRETTTLGIQFAIEECRRAVRESVADTARTKVARILVPR